MFVVSWGGGRYAVVQDNGWVIEGDDDDSLREVLGEPITRMVLGDNVETLQPGTQEHTRAALESLPLSTVTEEPGAP
jgi:hypothetical protein